MHLPLVNCLIKGIFTKKLKMAVLHKKEEKIQAVLGRLPKKYTDQEFIAMFIKLYSKDWGKIKSAYIKQSQDKEPGTVINMPKPELYLKQVLENYLSQQAEITPERVSAPIEKAKSEKNLDAIAPAKKTVAKKTPTVEEPVEAPKKVKAKAEKSTDAIAPAKKTVAKKKTATAEEPVEAPKKVTTKTEKSPDAIAPAKKAVAKKKTATAEEPVEAPKKAKATAAKTAAETTIKVAKPKAVKK
jgi:hypothetical protein